MGGVGSGRHWRGEQSRTTEDMRCLDVRRWAREGLLRPGSAFGWQWSVNGQQVAQIHCRAISDALWLSYRTRRASGPWRDMDYPVRLTSQACHFGGSRIWFECPARGCGARVACLYGGEVFACRKCQSLTYSSQREPHYQLAFRKVEKLQKRLGWEIGFDSIWGKRPRGMHHTTFDRLTSELEYWDRLAHQSLSEHLSGLREGASVRAPKGH
jgi:hypothetical protein